jgi:hypothetical protein
MPFRIPARRTAVVEEFSWFSLVRPLGLWDIVYNKPWPFQTTSYFFVVFDTLLAVTDDV